MAVPGGGQPLMQGTRKGSGGPAGPRLLLWVSYSDVGRAGPLSLARKLLERPILSPSEPAAQVLEWTPSSPGQVTWQVEMAQPLQELLSPQP